MLHRIAEEIWGHEGEVVMAGGLKMPTRATLIRLPSGELVLHSPIAIDEAVAAEIRELGEVKWLIAPNAMHWLHLRAALERYPWARVIGASGLEKKLPGLSFEPLPKDGSVADFGDALLTVRIEGAARMNEQVFLHGPSRSLVVSDLMFNVHRAAFRTRWLLRLVGAFQKPTQSRLWRFLVDDRGAAARSAQRVLGWDFDRIVVGHGDVVAEDARRTAERALSWMTAGAPKLLGAGSAIA